MGGASTGLDMRVLRGALGALDRRTLGSASLGRRGFMTGVAGLAGASMLLPGSARADRYGPQGGTRVLVIGDSMIAGGFGLYLARALGEDRGYDVTRRGKSSSGLARPDFFNQAVAQQMIEDDGDGGAIERGFLRDRGP